MSNLNLNLSLEEANLILAALGERPFREVFELVGKIQQQASEQLVSQGQTSAVSQTLTAVSDNNIAEAV